LACLRWSLNKIHCFHPTSLLCGQRLLCRNWLAGAHQIHDHDPRSRRESITVSAFPMSSDKSTKATWSTPRTGRAAKSTAAIAIARVAARLVSISQFRFPFRFLRLLRCVMATLDHRRLKISVGIGQSKPPTTASAVLVICLLLGPQRNCNFTVVALRSPSVVRTVFSLLHTRRRVREWSLSATCTPPTTSLVKSIVTAIDFMFCPSP